MSTKRLSRWLGALALGAALTACGATPATPIAPPTGTSSPAASTTTPTPVTSETPTSSLAPAPASAPAQTLATSAKRTTVAAKPPAATTKQAAPVACSGGYVNVDGNCVPRPTRADSPPAGATARCKDGTYSFSQHRQGTCSGHGGVAQWL